jgi:hypothetical protein
MRALLARLLALAALLALAGGASAHRPAPRDAMLVAWLAAGGSLNDLCADHPGALDHPGPCCPACPPAPAPAPGPRPAAAPAAARRLVGRVGAAWPGRRAHPTRRPTPGRPRAPPPSPA